MFVRKEENHESFYRFFFHNKHSTLQTLAG